MSWTSDDSTTSAELAINGVIEATLNFFGTFSGATTKDTSTYTLGMQKNRFHGSDLYSFKGHISNPKMFNRKLHIDEIKKDFAQSIDIPDLSAVWIGLNRTDHTSEFSWSDGSPHDYFTSLVTNHHCAASGKDGQWFGRHCLEKKPLICEKAAE
ncbi:snaclec stejaggregin-B subunit beta-1-like isoform X2 [Actinia tenebrosa]|nr:snaclec stejaggregin-B subunit beta-1-like isoform X2 [Actinia tenebrosa]XP_031573259.1 snaclec stejaggregin-B subunit beta-1-like isoform X2 [Actinia tenebrosa]XP_031573267.1 snaclec stejaggregin-B subunit beta-1-like isoform X2 [Actinia tenebrosa]XP_031573274.1 snaclec stejaggregin-B subunit beta-1-like isoform X2 [Actinia tenebrosa]